MSHTKAALDAQRSTLEVSLEVEEAWASRHEKISVNVQGTWQNGASFNLDISGERGDVTGAIESLKATGNLQGELYITERKSL